MCKYANEFIFATTSDKLNSEPKVQECDATEAEIKLLALVTQLKKSI